MRLLNQSDVIYQVLWYLSFKIFLKKTLTGILKKLQRTKLLFSFQEERRLICKQNHFMIEISLKSTSLSKTVAGQSNFLFNDLFYKITLTSDVTQILRIVRIIN